MTPHHVDYPRRPAPEYRVSIPLILGLVAVIFTGILVLTSGI